MSEFDAGSGSALPSGSPTTRRAALAHERAHRAAAMSAPQPGAPVVDARALHVAAMTAAAELPPVTRVDRDADRQSALPTRRSLHSHGRRRRSSSISLRPGRTANRREVAPVTPLAAPSAFTRAKRSFWRRVTSATIAAGLVTTVAIPAYSLVYDDSAFAASGNYAAAQRDAQGVTVGSGANAQATGADQYSSVSGFQALFTRALSNNFGAPAVRQVGDDYPWWKKATEAWGGGLSPLGYYYRECVDFVAFRLNRDAGSIGEPWKYTWTNLASGSAWYWRRAWINNGWTVSSAPRVGAVAWFPYNHVAYVKDIFSDGTILIEEYNWMGLHNYDQRIISATEPTYLYPPSN